MMGSEAEETEDRGAGPVLQPIVEREPPGWLSDRLGWARIVAGLSAYRAPRRTFAFYLGGVTLFLLAMQVASGILLVLYYQPDSALAHASVERISNELPYGNLIRNVHLWAGDLFVAALFAHLFTILIRRTFKPPHELSWLSGMASLVLGIGLAFTGTILPWSERAYAHARVGTELAKYVPLIGGWLRGFLRGGEEVGTSTLGHAYGFHVAALPAAMTALIGFHLFFLSRKPAEIPEKSKGASIPLYPDFLVRLCAALTGVFVVVMTLAIFFDRPLGPAANPLTPSSAGAHPPWYFLPIHQIVRMAPKQLLGMDGARFLVGIASLLGVVALALPFIDRKGSKITAWFAWGLLLVLLLLCVSALN